MRRDQPILRLFLVNWALGIGLGVVFAGALLWFDLGGLASLLRKTDMLVEGAALLFGGFAFTCGGVVCGSAVMFHAGRDRHDPPKGLGTPAIVAQIVRIRP